MLKEDGGLGCSERHVDKVVGRFRTKSDEVFYCSSSPLQRLGLINCLNSDDNQCKIQL